MNYVNACYFRVKQLYEWFALYYYFQMLFFFIIPKDNVEEFLNVFTGEEKMKVIDEVWEEGAVIFNHKN